MRELQVVGPLLPGSAALVPQQVRRSPRNLRSVDAHHALHTQRRVYGHWDRLTAPQCYQHLRNNHIIYLTDKYQ